jgi:CDP-glycerol glycerophosphotransferase (TagB/SpsB family)
MSDISLDVIVAAYNAEQTIGRCLNSILGQTYKHVRVIVVDDGSVDNTLGIVDGLSRSNPGRIIVKSQANSGPSVARNVGLACSDADFVGFVDADDFISEDMYSEMLSLVDNETDLVICGRNDVLKGGGLKPILPNIKNDNQSVFSYKRLLYGTSPFVWDKVYRRSTVEEFGIHFPEQVAYAEDAVFLTLFKLHARKCRVVSKALYFYSESSEGSITNECNVKWLDIPASLSIIVNYYMDKGWFFYFWRELEVFSVGFYKRRIKSLPRHSNKKMQIRYISQHSRFMDQNFPGWRKRSGSILYGNDFFAYFFALIPNSIKMPSVRLGRSVRKIKRKNVVYRYFQKFFPIYNSVSLYISYSGDSISDSPMYLAKAEVDNERGRKVYFASRHVARDRTYCKIKGLNFEVVPVRSLRYIWLLAVAGRVVTNSRVPTFFNKRKSQVLVNTWHGTPIKTLGASMSSGIKDIGRNQNQFLMSDFLLFPNQFTKEKMTEDFSLSKLYSGTTLVSGYPRNDPFLSLDAKRTQELKAKLGIEGKKLVVYLPTWRGASIGEIDSSRYISSLNEIFNELDEKLDSNTVFYVKLHQSVGGVISGGSYRKIRPFPDGYDLYEFLSCSDLLVTDYSSVMFDYLYQKKPILLFLYDYDEYVKERGFYIDVKDVPFSKAFCVADLVSFLNSKEVCASYDGYVERFCTKTSSTFSEDLLNLIGRSKVDNSSVNLPGFHVKVFDGLLSDSDAAKILNEADHAGTIIAFHHSDVNEKTEKFINMNKGRLDPFVIIPGEMPVTVGEKLNLILFEKYGVLSGGARRFGLNEMSRVFPGINVLSLTNYSSRKIFSVISRAVFGRV